MMESVSTSHRRTIVGVAVITTLIVCVLTWSLGMRTASITNLKASHEHAREHEHEHEYEVEPARAQDRTQEQSHIKKISDPIHTQTAPINDALLKQSYLGSTNDEQGLPLKFDEEQHRLQDTSESHRVGGSVQAPTNLCPQVNEKTKSFEDQHHVFHDGFNRSYRIYIPASLCSKKHPITNTPDVAGRVSNTQTFALVVLLHCYGCPCGMHSSSDQFITQAEQRGFVLLQPCGGTSGIPSWNAPPCCGNSLKNNVDDVGFIETSVATAIDRLKGTVLINKDQIFASGFSNGGYMTSLLARKSKIFKALAPVSGYESSRSNPIVGSHSKAIMIHHGLHDKHVSPFGCCVANKCISYACGIC